MANDFELRGMSKLTISSYRQEIEALLGENAKPIELDIKRYLAEKRKSCPFVYPIIMSNMLYSDNIDTILF